MKQEQKKNTLTLILIFFPNLIPLSLSLYLDIGRPYVNADYLLAAALVLSPLKWAGFLVLFLAILADKMLIIGQIFPFIRIDALIYIIKFTFQSSTAYQLMFSLLIFSVVLSAAALSALRRKGAISTVLITLNIALAFYTYNVYSPKSKAERIWRITDRPIASSQLITFFDLRSTGFIKKHYLDTGSLIETPYEAKTKAWMQQDVANLNHRLLLILAESWGVHKNKDVQEAILSPILETENSFQWLFHGELDFSGSTVAGELKELCHLEPVSYNLVKVEDGLESCLPNILKSSGYQVSSYHGALGTMYDRIHWYPKAGFEKSTFFESKRWPQRCYSFPGACDMDVIREIEEELSHEGKKFIYWLTLNSHSIYDLRDLKIDVFDCHKYDIPDKSETCRNLKLHAQFFHVLAESLGSEKMKDLEVIIIGDHPPPIIDLNQKEKNFKDKKVSWLHLKTQQFITSE